MSFVAFGNKDTLVVQAMYPGYSPVSTTTRYTHPSMDVFFSHHGFAYPITLDTVPLHVAVDDLYPVVSETVKDYFPTKKYILIDHKGRVWRTVIQPDENNEQVISSGLIHCPQGWWVTTGGVTGRDDTKDLELANTLVGFLYPNPPKKAIDTFWAKHFNGQELQWLNIPDIVARLKKDFPRDLTLLARRKARLKDKKQKTKSLNQLIEEIDNAVDSKD